MAPTAFIQSLTLRTGSSGTLQHQSSFVCRRRGVSGAVVTPSMRSQYARMSAITPEVARAAVAVYGVAISGGGIAAFLRTGSKPSAISGVVAGIVLGAAYVKDSIPIALGTAVALSVVFAIRLVKTKKFVPAGVLGAISVAAAVLFAVAFYG